MVFKSPEAFKIFLILSTQFMLIILQNMQLSHFQQFNIFHFSHFIHFSLHGILLSSQHGVEIEVLISSRTLCISHYRRFDRQNVYCFSCCLKPWHWPQLAERPAGGPALAGEVWTSPHCTILRRHTLACHSRLDTTFLNSPLFTFLVSHSLQYLDTQLANRGHSSSHFLILPMEYSL